MKTTTMPLRFRNSHATFQADLAEIAIKFNLTLLEVWRHWKNYSNAMEASGQSAVLGEFEHALKGAFTPMHA